MKTKLQQLVERYRQLGIDQQIDYDKFYLYSLITHSTAIEGSTITEVENQIMFDHGVSIKGKSLGGTNPTVSLNTSSGVTVNWSGCGWATSLGLSSLDEGSLYIQATPYGRNSGGSDKYDTALAVSSYSSNQCRIFTSNDTNYSASSFFIKIEYIL